MKLMFGVLSLLVALGVVALLAKQQMKAVTVPLSAGPSSASSAPSGTPVEQSRRLQDQIGRDVQKALEQGAQRNREANQ